jgi:16S rRNA G527 N7-methylase RsmG
MKQQKDAPAADVPAETPAEAPAETPAERRRRRAAFLRELTEAKELQARVHPRRTKAQRMRQAVMMRTFRA